jgi:hypothetical protein
MAATGSTRATDDETSQRDAATNSLVAYVKDSTTGEISVMSGDREVVVRNRRLAQQLARIAD